MSVNGEERDHRRGELLTASGETKVAIDTASGQRRRPWSPIRTRVQETARREDDRARPRAQSSPREHFCGREKLL
jgi:hypothetical protein